MGNGPSADNASNTPEKGSHPHSNAGSDEGVSDFDGWIARDQVEDRDKESQRYVRRLTEAESLALAEDQQTTATWINFYQWFTTHFPSLVTSDEFAPELFALHKHYDLQKFLRWNIPDPTKLEAIMKLLQAVHEQNTIRPLIELYSSDELQFFSILNKQLANPTGDVHRSPHLCDRVIFEFYLRQRELRRLTFTGKTYSTSAMSASELAVYQRALASNPPGIIALKTFTSTSKSKDIAFSFMKRRILREEERNVLFVFEIADASPTIVDIETISQFPSEREVLLLPHNLFTVTLITEDEKSNLTTVDLRYKHIRVPSWKKLHRIIRSARKSVI